MNTNEIPGPEARMAVQMNALCAAIGQPMWSDELLGKLLAWAVATGFLPCTTRQPMFSVLMVARERFGIEGGHRPNQDRLRKFYYPRLKELRRDKTKTKWLPELMNRYHVKDWQAMDYSWADDIQIPKEETQ